jgi:cytochrome c-type biogenesis protein CcmH
VKKTKTLASLIVSAACVACGGSSAPRTAASPAPPDSGDLKPIGTREAQPSPSLPPGHPKVAPGATAGSSADVSLGRVAGTVLLSPKLAAGPGDVLYLIAKQGATTLAVRRIDKPAFPLDFELTGADAMVSGVPFVGPVDLVARLSRTGDAIPAKGDLEGVTKGVAVPAAGVKVTIDTTRS